MKVYSVWVGGVEVNSHYLNKDDAERIAEAWKSDDYDEVAMAEYEICLMCSDTIESSRLLCEKCEKESEG